MEPPLPLDKHRGGREFGHDAARVHAAGQHVSMVTVGGDGLVTLDGGHFPCPPHSFLSDIEVAEAAEQAHAIKLAAFSSKRRINSMSR